MTNIRRSAGKCKNEDDEELAEVPHHLSIPTANMVNKILGYENSVNRQLRQAIDLLERLQRQRRGRGSLADDRGCCGLKIAKRTQEVLCYQRDGGRTQVLLPSLVSPHLGCTPAHHLAREQTSSSTRARFPSSSRHKSRGYCLGMICADFLAGAHLQNGSERVLFLSMLRLFPFLPPAEKAISAAGILNPTHAQDQN